MENEECDCDGEGGSVHSQCGKTARERELAEIDAAIAKGDETLLHVGEMVEACAKIAENYKGLDARDRMLGRLVAAEIRKHAEKRNCEAKATDKSGGDAARCGKCGKFYVDHADDDCHG
jgi:hypothetical protein